MTSKPRGPVPSLIGSTLGRPRRAEVKKKSECSRCHGGFVAGDQCIEIPKLGSGFTSHRRVCDACFKEILQKTADDLNACKAL